MDTVDPSLIPSVMTWVYRKVLQGLEWALLYGGINREFEPSDSERIMTDLLVRILCV